MTKTANGSFEVAMRPLDTRDAGAPPDAQGATLGRMALDKTFSGGLVAVGKGEMLTALTPVKGSAGYVAIERVTGTLHGRAGSFVFQHSGLMDHGQQQLSITVVPDSGTGELLGLSGQFKIQIEAGQHHYAFEYDLPS